MKQLQFIVGSVMKMMKLGSIIAHHASTNMVFALTGDLGAGKTTFTKGIGQAFGVQEVINSPTFTIMKIHQATNPINHIQTIYHLDVYRLQDSYDDFELEEYFHMDGLTIIEWADIIRDLLPKDTWKMAIQVMSENERKVTMQIPNEQIAAKLYAEVLEAGYEVVD